MDTSERFAIVFFFVIATIAFCVSIYNLNQIDANRSAVVVTEIKLTDGTPCALNKNGGIACNWKIK